MLSFCQVNAQNSTNPIYDNFLSKFNKATLPLRYGIERTPSGEVPLILKTLQRIDAELDSVTIRYLDSIIPIFRGFDGTISMDDIGQYYALNKIAIGDSIALLTILYIGNEGGWNYEIYGVLIPINQKINSITNLLDLNVLFIAGAGASCDGEAYTSCTIDKNLNINTTTVHYGGCDANYGKFMKVSHMKYKIRCANLDFERIIPLVNSKKKSK